MNRTECAEVRRTYATERSTVSKIYGAYVNSTKEIIAKFERSLFDSSEDECDKYLALFRKTLSGKCGRNLIDIPFTTEEVASGEKHKLLRDVLKGDEGLDALYKKIIESYESKENYVILLARSKYDVIIKAKDGESSDSGEVYSFFTVAICPVKLTKAALAYDPKEKLFAESPTDNVIMPPEAGFTFPAFDERRTNLYSALFYTKSADEAYTELTSSLFGGGMKMPANEQKKVFREVISETISDNCSYEVVKNIRRAVGALVEEHKASKEREELYLTKHDVRDILSVSGVKAEALDTFSDKFTENFGSNADVLPENVIDIKKTELRTPDVVIRVAPGKEDLVRTEIIDGVEYILIRADEGVEFNGLGLARPAGSDKKEE